MIYATQQELLQEFAKYNKVIKINAEDLQLFGVLKGPISTENLSIDIPYNNDSNSKACSVADRLEKIFNQHGNVDQHVRSVWAQKTLIIYMQEIENRVRKYPWYIQDKEGLTRDTRDMREFIGNNREDLKGSLVIHVMKLLHQLSLNDQKYYQAFNNGPTSKPVRKDNNNVAPVIYSLQPTTTLPIDTPNFKLNDDEPYCKVPDFSKCSIM